jgi:CheY-like chemotaxis protein
MERDVPDPTSSEERLTILVVDDDHANLRTFQRVFRRQLRVLVASSGEEALESLGTANVDLALVDYAMPQMDGGALLEIVRQRHPSVVRVLLTGSADLDAVREMQRNGLAFAVLRKPWSRAMIDEAILAATRVTQHVFAR